METAELLQIIARGDDTRHQFKLDAANAMGLAPEIAAFSNASGGQIFIGVGDGGGVHPLIRPPRTSP